MPLMRMLMLSAGRRTDEEREGKWKVVGEVYDAGDECPAAPDCTR